MRLYHSLSKLKFLAKSFTGKFLFVAFLGIHIPLIGLILLVVFHRDSFSSQMILVFTLLFTLLATAITLYIIKQLMMPIAVATQALNDYRDYRKVPDLPMQYKDEAGQLLCNIQQSINDNENHLVEKQDLIYLLSHDIKAYAAHPKSIAEFIEEEESCTDAIKEYTKLLKSASDKQIGFLASFIHLLHDEEGLSRTKITPRIVDFNRIANDIKQQLTSQFVAKNITLTMDVAVTPLKLYIDEILLSRVVFNLVHNAMKFSYVGGVIDLKAVITNDYLEVRVLDTGIGFKPSSKEYLFTKFSNMSRKGTDDEKSTGIGLYLCRQIVTKFDGYIEARSLGENQGATFTVGLKTIK
ncbi:sensor histidine kinase [Flavobacterium sp.]